MKPHQTIDNRRPLFGGDKPSAVRPRLPAQTAAGESKRAEAAAATATSAVAARLAALELNRSKTPPIPLPETHIPRTSSELELTEEIAMAEYREKVMFHRLVSGMRERAELSRRLNQLNQQRWGAVRVPQVQNQHQPQPQPQQISRQYHAEVLDEALRLTADTDDSSRTTELLEAATASMTQAARDSRERALAAAAGPQEPRGQAHAESVQRRQNLANVLEKVVNDDWSIEGYDNYGDMGHYDTNSHRYGAGANYGCGVQAHQVQQHGAYNLPQFPVLPPVAAAGGCGAHAMMIEPSPSVPTCCALQDEDDMVFSMDL